MESRHCQTWFCLLWALLIPGLALSASKLFAFEDRAEKRRDTLEIAPFPPMSTPAPANRKLRPKPAATDIPSEEPDALVTIGSGYKHARNDVLASQKLWRLPPGMKRESLLPPIAPSPGSESGAVPHRHHFWRWHDWGKTLRAPEKATFGASQAQPPATLAFERHEVLETDAMELAPEPAVREEDTSAGFRMPRLRPTSFLSPLIGGLQGDSTVRDQAIVPSAEPEGFLRPDPIELAPEPVCVADDEPAGLQLPRIRPGAIICPLLRRIRTSRGCHDRGIGYERVATAPFVIDIAQPMNHFAFRTDAAYGWKLPDRAELLFARPASLDGTGPDAIERSVDFQDLNFISEIGTPGLSVRTVVPVRVLDPEIGPNTAGLGDIQLCTKTRLLGGQAWTITQINNFFFASGCVGKGLGTGHTSMEPGVLASYKWSDETFFHGELKFLFPMGGHPSHHGNLLTYGFGLSHLWYDRDSLALIPTVEAVFYSILDGEAAVLATTGPTVHGVDGETISTLHFGLRVVSDTSRDFGLVELGVSGGLNLDSSGWYDSLLRVELRTTY